MEEIQNKSEPMQKYFQELEQYVIKIIAARLNKTVNMKADDLDGLLKVQNINDDLRTIKNKITETIDKGRTEIYNIVENCEKEYYEEAVKKPFEQNRKISRLVEQTKRESFEQFRRSLKFETLGFDDADGTFKFLEQAYREIINNAVAKTTKNDGDIAEFIETTLENLAETGLMMYGD